MGFPLGLLSCSNSPLIVDGHIDTPQRMLDMKADITTPAHRRAHRCPRMREGGAHGRVLLVWVDARYAGAPPFSARWT